jgi:5-methylcytosine-specific restriction protein A
VSLRVCPVPGCPNLTPGGRCTEHQRQADRARGTASQRGYTSAGHRAFREQVLARDPVCKVCRQQPSTVADHYPTSRRDLLEQGLDPNDPVHGRGLCLPCHSRETAEHQPGGWNRT